MAGGRPAIRLELTDLERAEYTRIVKARMSPQAEAKSARAILLSTDGLDDKEVGKRVGFSNSSAAT